MEPKIQNLTMPLELEIGRQFCLGIPEGFDNICLLIFRSFQQEIDYAMTYYRFVGDVRKLDVPDPEFDFFESVKKLLSLLQKENVPWKEINYYFSLNETRNWKMKISYSYFD